jgi:hypothetical protein
VNIPQDDFREGILRSGFQRGQELVSVVINRDCPAHARTMHEPRRRVNFTAGLLHDIGKLLLADNPATGYLELMTQAGAEGEALIVAGRAALQAAHAEAEAYLFVLSGLPLPLNEL